MRDNTIAGAAIDVFDTEPLPADHPFRSLPTAVVTPHIGYVVDEQYRIFYSDAVEDIAAVRRRHAGAGPDLIPAGANRAIFPPHL